MVPDSFGLFGKRLPLDGARDFSNDLVRRILQPRGASGARRAMIRLEDFRKAYGAQDFAARMSELIWRDIYELHTKEGINREAILCAIKDIELETTSNGTKTATPFKREPLKGLWHKHYFTAAYLPGNLRKEKPLNDIVAASLGAGGVTPTLASIVAAMHGNVVEMAANRKLTGEWIVFLRRGDTNYYLCCSKHTDDEQWLLDRIINGCTGDFPSLATWVQEARGTA
jgi:hypothetical protein